MPTKPTAPARPIPTTAVGTAPAAEEEVPAAAAEAELEAALAMELAMEPDMEPDIAEPVAEATAGSR